ncbi:MAG: carboxypeptidase regulatory-like domain-containing protein [Gemmatimonadales bacterium]|nr:MAG: carboxypeptidase regulatory-like domain-containing protein [Gemmatimonadales bacterium]
MRSLRGLAAGGVVLMVLLAGVACAQSRSPEGGPVPESPPEVLRAVPDTFAVRGPFSGPYRVDFSRRLSERPTSGSLRDAVVVSPRTGQVSVEVTRRGIEVGMEGGFREETIYRITLLPVLQDRFQNRFERPRDFFFSTGPDFDPTLVAGVVLDRITGEFVDGARIDAEPEEGGPTHSTVTDSTGVFTLPWLPPGGYRVTAYLDQNRNREPDFMEPQDAVSMDLGSADTLVLRELALLQPDTTAARVTEARVLDSMAIRVETDDWLDTDVPLEGVEVRLESDEGEVPGVARILHLREWEELEEERRAREAEEDPDEPDDPDDPDAVDDPDDVPPPPDPDDEVPEDEVEALFDDLPFRLPEQAFVVLLEGPLTWEAEYRIVVEELTNLHGIPGGGGEATFESPSEPDDPEDPDDDTDDDGDGGDSDGEGPRG